MRISIFLFVSAMIFLGTHLLSVFWPFLPGANVFLILALTVFFLDREHNLNWPVYLGTAVFFDFWSSGPFGNLTLSLLLSILIIFIIKKIMLVDSRGKFSDLAWLTGFYYLYIFLNSVVGSFYGEFTFPSFRIIDLALIIFWTIIMVMIHKLASYEKKVSRFRL